MVRFRQDHDSLTVMLFGEIDHHASQNLRTEIERFIKKTMPKHLIFDFSKVSFMDSSGIGMIIGRYKTMISMNGHVSACGLQKPVERLFKMAGLHRIISIMTSQEDKIHESSN